MIGYTTIGVNDIEQAKKFYTELFDATVQVDIGRLAMIGKTMEQPMVAVCKPFDGNDPSCGNGSMIAFAAASKEEVAEKYNKAISLGATSEGEPGQRIDDVFYGAYVRDLDGNKLAFYIFG
ncbi:MAG: VOC family protein [Aliishimia sp.]